MRKSVLIVEDEQEIREMLQLLLEIEGYQATTAANGRIALDQLKDRERPPSPSDLPCLILLDLMMPVMDGWAFIEAQHQDEILAEIPVVILTAFNERSASKYALKVLRKPLDLTDVLAAVAENCG